ncbi:MAG: hypothetical protein HY097_11010 [Nitrospinae bacterium]|nr:hypothetical protein [Nitrospinota bacterium]
MWGFISAVHIYIPVNCHDLSLNLENLNIKYLIIHSMDLGEGEWERMKRGLQDYESVVKPFKQFEETYVYEVYTSS